MSNMRAIKIKFLKNHLSSMVNRNPHEMTKEKSIAQIAPSELCTGCGTCINICPNKAIGLSIDKSKGIFISELDEELCNNCGLCYQVCPGHFVDYKELNSEIFKKSQYDIFLGNYLNCYTGHSTDHEIRYNSASGGLITQLLIFALEKGIINGALVSKMKKGKPLEAEPFIARTREEIIESAKSKYCPIPVNIGLKKILESNDNERFAVVGLPCHIQGIRKMEHKSDELKEKIILHIGIFCGHSPNFNATKFALKQEHINEKDVKSISYRGEGWPGKMAVEMADQSKKFFNYGEYWDNGFGLYFFPNRCTLCPDGVCELSDISFGDAWLPEFRKNDRIGESIAISRSKIGDDILKNCFLDKKIDINIIDPRKVIDSQKAMLNFKKKGFKARAFFMNLFGKKVPNYTLDLPDSNLNHYLDSIRLYFLLWISSKNFWILLYFNDITRKEGNSFLRLMGRILRKLGLLK